MIDRLPERATEASHAASASQKVLIVNGSSDVLETLEPLLEAGNYDIIFVESTAHAYSQIRKVQPDLVIMCVAMDDPEGLQVLTMLKLDAETRDIPVVTFASPEELTADFDGEEESDKEYDGAPIPGRPPLLMN